VEIDLDPVHAILAGMETQRRAEEGRSVDRTDLIPLLQKIQDCYGYLPIPALLLLGRKTGIPTSRMHGVITFYSQFHTQPRGRHTVRCCQGTACHVKGGKRIALAISQALGIDDGGTSADMRFSFETVACLGACFLAPVIMVNDEYYGNLSPDRIPGILDAYT
jgi:NADH-quinone oxidoreductase subunit E